MNFPSEALKEWFLTHKRPLPWRDCPTPYSVWVSEMMLQQTQASVVVPYYQRWMERFPTIEDLSEASLEEVIKLWEGLGYYARARNLHEGAKKIVSLGTFPDTKESLSQIKGIGPYTQGAILSFAFQKKAVAIDGNVKRVLARFFAIEEELGSKTCEQKLQKRAEELLPDDEPWLVVEGLIELGALVCQKSPKCHECPLKYSCLGFRHGLQHELPKVKQREKTQKLYRTVALIFCEGEFLVKKGEKGKVMGELIELPFIEEKIEDPEEIVRCFEEKLKLPLSYERPLKEESHSFTRFKAFLFPHLLRAYSRGEEKFISDPSKEAFQSGHRRILKSYFNEHSPY